MDAVIARRAKMDAVYRAGLADVEGITCLPDSGEAVANYSYFPVRVGPNYTIRATLFK